eukprot:3387409-Ditylum_brightwellii.AAC.1
MGAEDGGDVGGTEVEEASVEEMAEEESRGDTEEADSIVDSLCLSIGDEPGGTVLVDARNGFNELSRYAMLWMVQHRWQAGAIFVFNCYRHWALLIIHQPGQDPVVLHSKEGVTQGDPQSMVTYGITLVPLAEQIRAADAEVMVPFYADNITLDGPVGRNACQLKLLMEHGPDRGYFPEPDKSIHVCDIAEDTKKARTAFDAAGMKVNLHDRH